MTITSKDVLLFLCVAFGLSLVPDEDYTTVLLSFVAGMWFWIMIDNNGKES